MVPLSESTQLTLSLDHMLGKPRSLSTYIANMTHCMHYKHFLQELVFMEERCEDEKQLCDYGINRDFIKQVSQCKMAIKRLTGRILKAFPTCKLGL